MLPQEERTASLLMLREERFGSLVEDCRSLSAGAIVADARMIFESRVWISETMIIISLSEHAGTVRRKLRRLGDLERLAVGYHLRLWEAGQQRMHMEIGLDARARSPLLVLGDRADAARAIAACKAAFHAPQPAVARSHTMQWQHECDPTRYDFCDPALFPGKPSVSFGEGVPRRPTPIGGARRLIPAFLCLRSLRVESRADHGDARF